MIFATAACSRAWAVQPTERATANVGAEATRALPKRIAPTAATAGGGIKVMDWVLAGSMSLVGPRPEVPRYVACYPEAVRQEVLSVAPGITDWASIEYRQENAILGAASDPEQAYLDEVLPAKLAFYQRYVRERSFWLDLRIIANTVTALARTR